MSVRRAEGIWLEDVAGKWHADFYGNNAHHIGYRHPVLVEALHKQLDQLTFTARGLTSETSIELGETLTAMWGEPKAKVSFTPSGGDAIDALAPWIVGLEMRFVESILELHAIQLAAGEIAHRAQLGLDGAQRVRGQSAL